MLGGTKMQTDRGQRRGLGDDSDLLGTAAGSSRHSGGHWGHGIGHGLTANLKRKEEKSVTKTAKLDVIEDTERTSSVRETRNIRMLQWRTKPRVFV